MYTCQYFLTAITLKIILKGNNLKLQNDLKWSINLSMYYILMTAYIFRGLWGAGGLKTKSQDVIYVPVYLAFIKQYTVLSTVIIKNTQMLGITIDIL